MRKFKLFLERLKVCYYVLRVHTFVFCSVGSKENYKKGICCIEQNSFKEFEEVVSKFVGNHYKYAREENCSKKSS